jgi:hypothetical protein
MKEKSPPTWATCPSKYTRSCCLPVARNTHLKVTNSCETWGNKRDIPQQRVFFFFAEGETMNHVMGSWTRNKTNKEPNTQFS